MFRTVCTCALVASLVSSAARGDDGIVPGDPHKGEMPKEKIGHQWLGFVDTYTDFGSEVPIKLRAGQKVSFLATVEGTNRKVSIGLLDPSGKMIAATARRTAVKSVPLTVPAVNATGTYTVVVMSDQLGEFTVTATVPGGEPDLAALEAKRKRLQAELDAVNAEIEALKKKK